MTRSAPTAPASPMQAQAAAVLRKMQQRQRQAHGAQGQAATAARLIGLGFLCIETIETGWRKIAGKYIRAGKVAGDLRAVLPGGRAVLIECKSRVDELRLSDLEPHQVRSLQQHHEAGALSLLAWISSRGVFVIPWADAFPALTNGGPLTTDRGAGLALRKLPVAP